MAGRLVKRAGGIAAPSAHIVAALHEIERELGGRESMIAALSLMPLTESQAYAFGLLADPLNKKLSLAEIAARGNLTPRDLLQLFQDAQLFKAKLRAAKAVGERLGDVVEDVLRRAAPYEEPCDGCLGTGAITPDPTAADPNPAPGPCPACRGVGRVRFDPELDRQKVALEVGGLLGKGGGGLGIQVNVMAGGNGARGAVTGAGAFDALIRATDEILFGGVEVAVPSEEVDLGEEPPVVEGEVVPPEESA